MTNRDFDRLFAELNARQMRADRAVDRVFSVALIVALALSAVCIGVTLAMVPA